jgi:hypothetical protein
MMKSWEDGSYGRSHPPPPPPRRAPLNVLYYPYIISTMGWASEVTSSSFDDQGNPNKFAFFHVNQW